MLLAELKKTTQDWFCLDEKNLWLTPNRVLTAQTEWVLSVRLRHFSTTCAVYIEDCEGWWLSGCCSSVAEHWLHKPGVLGLIAGNCQPFHFPLFLPLSLLQRYIKDFVLIL